MSVTNDSSESNWTAQQQYAAFQLFWRASTEFHVQWVLRTCVPPVFIVFGTIGNLLSIVVLRRKYAHTASVGYYLSVLAGVNTIILCMVSGLEWLAHVSSQPLLPNTRDWLCKVCRFAFHVIIHSTYWLVVVLLADRTVVLWYPLYYPSVCTLLVAKLMTVFVYVCLVTVSIHAMWTYRLGVHGCNIDQSQHVFQTTVWPWIWAIVTSYIPLLLMMSLIVVLLAGVWLYGKTDSATTQPRYISVTLAVAIAFVALSLPSVLLNIIEYSNPTWLFSFRSIVRLKVISELFQTLSCLNQASTHLLYLAFMPNMRAHTYNILRRLCCRGDVQIDEGSNGVLVSQTIECTPPESVTTV